MERIVSEPCKAQIAFISTGEVDTTSNFGERKNMQSEREAYLLCEAIGCGMDEVFPNASDSDIEEFLTENCKLKAPGQELMIR